MQSETGFPSSHQLKSYVASKSRLKFAARAVLSADAGLLVKHGVMSASATQSGHKKIEETTGQKYNGLPYSMAAIIIRHSGSIILTANCTLSVIYCY